MNRIKELRKRKNMTVAELAKELGISQSMLTNYENGNGIPRDTTIWKRLAEIFEVSESHVMGMTTDVEQLYQKNKKPDNQEFVKRIIQEAIKSPVSVKVDTEEEFLLLTYISYLDDEDIAELLKHAIELIVKDKYKEQEIVLPIQFE